MHLVCAEQMVCLRYLSGGKEGEEHLLIQCKDYNDNRVMLLHQLSNIINNIHFVDQER